MKIKGPKTITNVMVENKKLDPNSFLYNHKRIEKPSLNSFNVHLHNAYEMIFFVGGDATQIVENRAYKLKKNDLIIVRPLKYHYIEINSPKTYERHNLLFDPKILGINNINLLPEDFDIVNCTNNKRMVEIFKKLDFYHKNLPANEFADLSASLIKELFYNMRFLVSQPIATEYSILDPLFTKILDYINDNLFTIKNLEEVAKYAFISKSQLFKLFNTFLKTSPKQYVINKRLLSAQNFIVSGEHPTSVYLKCGFSDYSSFYRSYRQYFGHSPSTTEKINFENF